jgi:hypothetical protein
LPLPFRLRNRAAAAVVVSEEGAENRV